MKESITVLLTSCGGIPVPGMVDSLHSDEEFRFRVVGVDVRADAVGRHIVDTFHTVPSGSEPDYAEVLLKIAISEGVDVILPLSDEEVLGLAPHKERFRKNGIKVACSEQDVVETATDKGRMLQFLEGRDVPVPQFAVPETLEELDRAVDELGYPEKEVVLKPTRARGARGFRIFSDLRRGADVALGDRCMQRLPYPLFRSMMEGETVLPGVVVMEYLGGTDYNVDVLAEGGKTLYCMPMVRVVPDAGPVQVGRIVHDPLVSETVEPIIEAFGFDYHVNVEMAYRSNGDNGPPLLYEINPRVSAPIVGHRMAGVDLLKFGIIQALGRPFPTDLPFKDILMKRCWREVYAKE